MTAGDISVTYSKRMKVVQSFGDLGNDEGYLLLLKGSRLNLCENLISYVKFSVVSCMRWTYQIFNCEGKQLSDKPDFGTLMIIVNYGSQ